jgi:hypothetical protein
VQTTWLDKPEYQLAQGDILSECVIGGSVSPPKFLHLSSHTKKDRTTWSESEIWLKGKDGFGHFVARGRFGKLMVVSHSCEVDKSCRSGQKGSILVAPLRPLSDFPVDHQVKILNSEKAAFFPLVGMPSISDHYVDLRSITAVQARYLLDLDLLCSMTKESTEFLKASLVGFFTRLGLPEDEDPQ